MVSSIIRLTVSSDKHFTLTFGDSKGIISCDHVAYFEYGFITSFSEESSPVVENEKSTKFPLYSYSTNGNLLLSAHCILYRSGEFSSSSPLLSSPPSLCFLSNV